MIGVLLTAGIALLSGIIVGVLYKIINHNDAEDQFNDNVDYRSNNDSTSHNVIRTYKEIE
jgi:hypothetical protein